MSHIAESLNLSQVRRIESYINDRGLTVAQIKAETGATWVLNGLMWNGRTGKVCNLLKQDGEVVFDPVPPYTANGYSWDVGPDVHMEHVPSTARNYLACTELIVRGQPVEKPIYDPAQGGIRGRTAIGTKEGRICAYISKDGSGEARTPEQLRDLLASYGWQDAVMLDSGGSSQGDLGGRVIRADRIVKHLLLVYTEEDKPAPEPAPSGYDPVVRPFLRSVDGDPRLSPHFKLHEFASKDGTDQEFVSPALWDLLEAIRTHFGKPVTITSGYRSPAHNRAVGGSPKSQHMRGLAADIVVPGVSPEEVGRYARQLMPQHGGVGVYMKKGFTHVDVRQTRSDWRE